MDIGQGLMAAWAAIVSFVPRLAAFLIILILGWLIAKFVGRMVAKGLEKVGLDRAISRSGVGEYFQRTRYDASHLCGRIIYYIGLLITLQLAFSIFGPTNPITRLLDDVIAFIPRAIVALVILVVAGMIAKAVRDVIIGGLGGLSWGRLLANVVGVLIMALGVIAALNQMGVATTVTQPVLIAVLATVGGILIVGVGGGLIRPMQQRWTNWLDAAERETERMREAGYTAGRGDALGGPAPQERRREEPARTGGARGTHEARSEGERGSAD